jgi:hypothetical protein
MNRTPFPIRPAEVVALTVHEFTFDLDTSDQPSLDAVCGRFIDDANRALVWLVRFRALQSLNDHEDMADWLAAGSRTWPDVCEVAARFTLNERWEFDWTPFCAAVDAVVSRRTGLRGA